MRPGVPDLAVALTVLLIAAVWSSVGRADAIETPWYGTDGTGQPTVRLYFFWTETCPHCRRAGPFVDWLAEELRWLEVRSLPLTEDRPHVLLKEDTKTMTW